MTDRAATYVRQSIADPDGITRARKLTSQLVTDRGWTLVAEYADDGVSASKSRDAGTDWATMLAEVKAGHIDVIVGVDMDRLMRSIKDLVTLIDLGVKVVTVDGEIDLTTAKGERDATQDVAAARFEVRRKAERQKRASADRASRGIVFKGGRRAFGWTTDNMTADPAEAAWVVWMHERLLAGDSLGSIARHLNTEGVQTTMGGMFTSLQIKAILRRPRNAGIFVYAGEVMPVSQIEPLVDLATHQAVLALLVTGTRNPRRHDAWLSGIIRCACGSTMHAKLLHRPGKQPVLTYVCSAATKATKQGVGPGRLGQGQHASIPAYLADNKTLITLYGLYSGGWLTAENNQATADIKRLSARLAELAAESVTLTEAFLIPGANKATVRTHMARVEADRKSTQDELNSVRAGSLSAEWLDKLMTQKPDEAVDSGTSAEAFERWMDWLSVDERRAVAKSLSITVALGRGKAERVSVEPAYMSV